jgi:hypothetical protein
MSVAKKLPKFYYATGTAWFWNAAGVAISTPPEVAFYTRFNPPKQTSSILFTSNIKALNGKTVPWLTPSIDTGNGDPFPDILDPTLWQTVRVVHPSSAIGMAISTELGVNFVVVDVLKSPVGTKFAVGGYSQGAAIAHRVIQETRTGGRLASRANDIVAAVTFGSPMREVNHTFPGSSGYSGACDVPGSTSGGHGTYPANLRMTNTPDWCWDFTMPNETISGVGDSADGIFMQQTVGLSLAPIFFAPLLLATQLAAWVGQIAQIGQGRGFFDWLALSNSLGVAPADVPRTADGAVLATDAVTGKQVPKSGGGHIMYPLFPPPNANGSIPATGDTCYQVAAKYLNTVGARLPKNTGSADPVASSTTAARIYVNVPDALNLLPAALDATFQGVKGLNAAAVRIPVAWKAVQPSSAQYFDWAATDMAVDRARAAGLRVLLVLSPPSPFWTTSTTVDPTAFSAFAGAAASRYKGKVAEYQVWDEPNANWPGRPNATQYAAVLKASHAAIKKADTAALVVFGGLRACRNTTNGADPRRVTIDPVDFLSGIFSAVSPHFDVLAYHPLSTTTPQYPFPPAPSGDSIAQHDRLYRTMTGRSARGSAIAPTKKVYWTAVGYELAQFTQFQQAYYLDTVRRLAQTRPEVTGLGVVSFRDYLV